MRSWVEILQEYCAIVLMRVQFLGFKKLRGGIGMSNYSISEGKIFFCLPRNLLQNICRKRKNIYKIGDWIRHM